MLRHSLIITRKDLRLLTRDRRALIVLLALPLILIAVIGSSTGRLTAPPPDDNVSESVAEAQPSRVYRTVVPGYTVLFVFFLINIMGRSFIQEREAGTLTRLHLAPITHASILAGKTLPFLCVSVVQTAVLLIAGIVLFDMPTGPHPWLMVPLLLATSLAATTLGLAFASWVRTDAQVSAWGNLLVLSTAGISGCLVPRHWMPEIMQQLSRATPHAWSLMGYREILATEQPDIVRVLTCCGVLLLFSGSFFAVGLRGFRRT